MGILTDQQKRQFWDSGYLHIDNAVTPQQLTGLRDQIHYWVEESRVRFT